MSYPPTDPINQPPPFQATPPPSGATPPQPVPQPGYGYPMVPYMAPYPAFQIVDRVEKQVNQLPLIALILSIVAWPLIITAPRTGNWDFFAGVVAVPAVVMAHIALARRPSGEKSSGYGMAIAALIVGYFLLSITFAWGILTFFPANNTSTF